jgi:hypothetical protein
MQIVSGSIGSLGGIVIGMFVIAGLFALVMFVNLVNRARKDVVELDADDRDVPD